MPRAGRTGPRPSGVRVLLNIPDRAVAPAPVAPRYARDGCKRTAEVGEAEDGNGDEAIDGCPLNVARARSLSIESVATSTSDVLLSHRFFSHHLSLPSPLPLLLPPPFPFLLSSSSPLSFPSPPPPPLLSSLPLCPSSPPLLSSPLPSSPSPLPPSSPPSSSPPPLPPPLSSPLPPPPLLFPPPPSPPLPFPPPPLLPSLPSSPSFLIRVPSDYQSALSFSLSASSLGLLSLLSARLLSLSSHSS